MSRHTCDALGCCQQRTPAFLGCEHHALASSVQASRDTGCCAQLLEADDSITQMERIGYWLSVTLAVGMSVVITFGAAGYLAVKLFV